MKYKGYSVTQEFPSGMYVIRPEVVDNYGTTYRTLRADTFDGLKELVDNTDGVVDWS